MRITGGSLCNRKIEAPGGPAGSTRGQEKRAIGIRRKHLADKTRPNLGYPGSGVEPVPDRVREALFSILQHVVPGARVLDLFACSGSLGIEALSRGADSVLFVEKDSGCANTISQNLESLGIANKAEVLAADALTILSRLKALDREFDLAFIDPPYALSDSPNTSKSLEKLIVGLFEQHILVQGGITVFRQRRGASAVLADRPDLSKDIRTYGTTQVTFIERAQS